MLVLILSVSVATAQEESDSLKTETKTDTLKSQAKEVVLDSLGSRAGTVVDSTIVDEAKAIVNQAAKDSLNNYVDIPDVALDSTLDDRAKSAAKTRVRSEIENEVGVKLPDVALDSTASDQLKSEAKSRTRAMAEEKLGTDIPDVTIDSTTTRQVKDEAVKRGEEMLKDTEEFKAINDLPKDSELGQLDDYKNKLEQTQEELRQAAAKQELKKKMASHAREYISQNADKIQQVQSQMGELKKKYSYMPNSNDLSSAVKRTSLKGESFWKRLVLGGNFNISKTNPLSIDLSPVVGYKVNKLFEVGITGAYRTKFRADKYGVNQQINDEVYGYSAFANHMAFKNFFGYLEGERMRTSNLNSELPERTWKQTLLIGVGRKFNVAKWLEMQAMVLFNVLHDNQDGLYNSPVVFKTGVRLRK
ncbi:hypothetical protein [Fulvivirga imtechensis]|uniref:hypothetical protein n=1 Tax=Fulvivirga imtechensis TaxID=881893 RepID=UPI0012F70DFF|nr:hypothetical protein [Fulvivirga imtechensis]